jgi:hypothetical protein
MPASRVVATGAPRFDSWFEQRPSSSQEEFAVRIGLEPARPIVLFLGSSPFVTRRPDREITFVRRWVESLRASDDELLPHVGILIRPHPTGRHWQGIDLSEYEKVVIWPPRPARPASAEARADFFDSIAHSAAVVGINTTAMIEAAIAGKSVLTILDQKFAQENTLHFHYLLAENGGFLHVASSVTEHTRQLAAVLDGTDDQADRRAGFVESFIRPHGLERPVTPIFADEVEKLASARVGRADHSRRLRLMLGVDWPLSSIALLCYPARRGLRRLRSRMFGQPSRGSARRRTA